MTSEQRPNENLPAHFSVGIGDLITIVWHRKLCLVVCLVAAFALGGVYVAEADRIYEVKCRVLVEKQDLPLGNSVPPQRSQRDAEFLGTQAEILGSPAVIELAVNRIHWPIPTNPAVSPVSMLKERISVRPVLGTNVLSLSLQADDAARAVQAIETLVDCYKNYTSRAEHDVHVDVLETLAKNEKEVRADLEKLEDQFRQLRERSPLISSFKIGSDVQLAHVEQLGKQLALARGRRVELENQLRIASLENSSSQRLAENHLPGNFINTSLVNSSSDAVVDSTRPVPLEAGPTLPGFIPQTVVGADPPGPRDIAGIQNKIVQARVLEKELYSRFGHKHPEVKAVEEQIASLLVEEQKALQAGHELLRRELDTVTANEKQLSELCKSELSQTKVLDGYHLEEQQLTGQMARVQEVHESLVGQLRQWKLTGQIASEGLSRIRIEMLETPIVPLHPTWPSPRILFGICGATGLISGLTLIALLELRNGHVTRQLQTTELVGAAASPSPAMPAV